MHIKGEVKTENLLPFVGKWVRINRYHQDWSFNISGWLAYYADTSDPFSIHPCNGTSIIFQVAALNEVLVEEEEVNLYLK